jgi:hypothetical protein
METWHIIESVGGVIGNCLGLYFCIKVILLWREDKDAVKYPGLAFLGLAVCAFYIVYFALKLFGSKLLIFS